MEHFSEADKQFAKQVLAEYGREERTKADELRRLDARARLPAQITAFSLGIVAALVTGLGICLSLHVIGSGNAATVGGIVIGLAGFAGMGLNYALYKKLLREGKEKYRDKILSLAREVGSQEAGE